VHQHRNPRTAKTGNELRSILREYYPAFLDTFAGKSATNLAKPEARAILAIAPTPAHATRLTKARIAAALRRAGRKRGIDDLATDILQHLRIPQLRQPDLAVCLNIQARLKRQRVARRSWRTVTGSSAPGLWIDLPPVLF
jgi:hypothetical protein